MQAGTPLVEIWRGPFAESAHAGHVVICDGRGEIVESWGDPAAEILPRSSVKMIQALPLIESGAAAAFGLTDAQLALACASHIGAPEHTRGVADWLAALGFGDDDLICGPQAPQHRETRHQLIRSGDKPCRMHNNCSGKHTGFLTLTRHLGAEAAYCAPDHPVQLAVRSAFEHVTGAPSPGFGIDGCSAPNFATTMLGLARAMAFFANAREDDADGRCRAAARLVRAMRANPSLVAGQGQACTELMGAAAPGVVVKTGAEAVYTAILPKQGLGVAVKITDGATRASECVIASLLVRLGVLDAEHPAAQRRICPPIRNWDGLEVGRIAPVPGVF